MKNRIMTVFTAAILSGSLLISCSPNSQKQANLDGRSQDPADTAKIDPNTGMLSSSNYYVSDNSSIMLSSSDYVAAKPAPNNDPQLMDNPSAVKNAARDNQRPNHASYVDSETGYVDKPGSGNDTQIAMNTNNNSQTFENEEENKNNASLAQKNHDLILQYEKELSSINNKISGNFNDKQYQQNKPLNPNGEAKGIVKNEVANFKAKKAQIEQQIAKLESDNKNNYQLTRGLISENKLKTDNVQDNNQSVSSTGNLIQ